MRDYSQFLKVVKERYSPVLKNKGYKFDIVYNPIEAKLFLDISYEFDKDNTIASNHKICIFQDGSVIKREVEVSIPQMMKAIQNHPKMNKRRFIEVCNG